MADDPKDVFQWQIYCNVEAAYVQPILRFRDEGAPTLCPNDHSNRTDFLAPTVIGVQKKYSVTANEPTTGIYEAQLQEFPIPAGQTGTITDTLISFPVN